MVCILTFSVRIVYGQTVVINEFMSSNDMTIEDEDGDHSDWIELYNPNSNPQNLTNYRLSDDPSEPDKWIFPNVTIPSNGYLLIFASDKDRYDSNELHTNFKIKQSGEALFLRNQNADLISSTPSIALPTDYSYSSLPNGGQDWYVVDSPTPNARNENLGGLIFSHPSGFYPATFELSVATTDPNAQIHYTWNGETPTSNSPVYTGPISITETPFTPDISAIPTTPVTGANESGDYAWEGPQSVYTANVIRFATFENGERTNEVLTKTYFVDPNVAERYTFPVVSLVTDSLNLFNYDTGIYIPGNRFDEEGYDWFAFGNYLNRGSEWERHMHLTYFEPDGQLAFETNAGMRMRGFGSTAMPQKSFVVYFRNKYGLKSIEHTVFSDERANTFKRLVFRNSGNDFPLTHFRDALLHRMLRTMDLEIQEFRPSVLFINGEYWGIHGIREKYDKHYFKNRFDIEEDNINILGVCGSLEEGSNEDYYDLIDFIEDNDITNELNYEHVSEKLDIVNFIDYNIAEIYYANADWPCNNYKMWKTNDPDSKWRFLVHDFDLSFSFSPSSEFDFPSLEHATSTGSSWPYCECSNTIFRNLLNNEDFVSQFLDRFAMHLGTTFDAQAFNDSIDEFEALFTPEIEEHIERWSYPSDVSEWQQHIEDLRFFASERPCFMSDHITEFFNLASFNFNCLPGIASAEEINLETTPNPSFGAFYLESSSPQPIVGDILITSIDGQVVHEEPDVILGMNQKHQFDLTYLANGTYVLNYFNEGFSKNIKVVVLH